MAIHESYRDLFADPDGTDSFNESMGRDITEVIRWAHDSQPRTRQVMLGPSELGEPCARKIAYRIAGAATLNRTDPWPALVGTAIHAWLEQAIGKFQAQAGAVRWLTETTVMVDDLVAGHVDLYDKETKSVIDFKTMNTDNLKKCRESGKPSESHRTQVHLYGMGMIRAGYPVERVGLIGLPRSGWLSGMWVWSEVYDEQIAAAALSRMYGIAEQVLELAVDDHPEQYMAIEATPSQLCTLCEFYRRDGQGGCPAK